MIPTSIILSGVESDRYWDIVVNQGGFKTVLMSFHYLEKKPSNFLRDRLEKHPDVRVFVDSGAFTFMSPDKIDGFKEKPESFWTDYLDRYTGWLKENADCVFACANLDIDHVVGEDTVDQWNKEYFEPLTRDYGIDVCYIWHANRGSEGWEDYCKKYDYVGMSTENDTLTLQSITRMVNVAKRYNARVHGMAITKTDLLVRVPLFSADSTTWIVGQQYGELNWFDGRGMKRLDKKTWRTTYKTRLLKEPFYADWDKLINGMGGRGDTYELLRLNVIAYKLAEEHIRKRLRTKMYWLKENSGQVDEDFKKDIDEIVLPDLEWFDGDMEDYKYYLRELHLSPDMDRDEALDLLYNFYVYIKGDEDDIESSDEELIDYCKSVLNDPVSSRSEAINKIRLVYIDNALGNRRDFISEEEDEELGRPKERSQYLQEDEFVTIDLAPEQMATMLPPPKGESMDEVNAYDEELKKNNIVPIRDSQGRFVKGQQKVRKQKNVYSSKMPFLNCNVCYKAGDCPEYKPGYVCAYKKVFSQFDTRNMEDIIDAMQSMANTNLTRMQRAMMFEVMDGGMATPEVTMLIDQNMRLLQQIKGLQESRAVVTQKTVLREDGTQETVTQMNVNPQGQGILSKIFSMSSTKSKEDENDIDESKVVNAEYKVD
jgi:hypothetical protein